MKICYYPLGDHLTASSRLRVHYVTKTLDLLGHDIFFDLIDPFRIKMDLIIVQKRHDLRPKVQRWMQKGLPVIYDLCDLELPIEPHTLLTVSTKALQGKIGGTVIPDCLDVTDLNLKKQSHSERLETVAWVGIAENFYNAYRLAKACEELGLTLVVFSQHEEILEFPAICHPWAYDMHQKGLLKTVKWDLHKVDRQLIECDVLACPFVLDADRIEGIPVRWPRNWVECKSENRLLKGWALGIPTVGSSLPAYVEYGLRPTLIADTVDEWISVLDRLRPKHARVAAAPTELRRRALRHRPEQIGALWNKVIEQHWRERRKGEVW